MQATEKATATSIIEKWRKGKASGAPAPLNLSETRKEAQRLKKAVSRDRYTYRVTWSQEDNEYLGLCLEFPSLSRVAGTPEKALSGIRRTVADVVADMQSSGEPVPQPLAEKHSSGEFQAVFRRYCIVLWPCRLRSKASA